MLTGDQFAQAMQGVKKDEGKTRFDLVPWDAMEQVAKVFTMGAVKYGDRDWELGMAHGRLVAAAFRHITAYLTHKDEGDLDPEFKTHHLANAACCVLMLLSSILRKLGTDDRPLTHAAPVVYDRPVGGEERPVWVGNLDSREPDPLKGRE